MSEELSRPLALTPGSPTPTRPGTASRTTPTTSSASRPRVTTLLPASNSRRHTTRCAPTSGLASGTSSARLAPSLLPWSLEDSNHSIRCTFLNIQYNEHRGYLGT